ncbi:MAG TPA: hypothetical protein PKV96_03035 [Candidatus Saccharimonas sp.]|nr:hypothetical protein [Candidatus Saccharimonas sp.]
MIKKIMLSAITSLVVMVGMVVGFTPSASAAVAPYYYTTSTRTGAFVPGNLYVTWKCDGSTNKVLSRSWSENIPYGQVVSTSYKAGNGMCWGTGYVTFTISELGVTYQASVFAARSF